MKKAIYFFGLLFFIMTVVFYWGFNSTAYLSNSNDKSIMTKLFNIECRIYFDEMSKVPDLLAVDVFYNNLDHEKVKNLKIFPINSVNGDSLKQDTAIANPNFFLLPKKWNKELDLVITYSLDSSGVVIHKKVSYTKLKQVNIWKVNFSLH